MTARQANTGIQLPPGGWRSHIFPAVCTGCMVVFVGAFVALLVADALFVDGRALRQVLASQEIRHALWLSLWTTTVTVLIGLLIAIPVGYALSRFAFPGRVVVDSVVDMPIIFPPIMVGLSLLVFFQTAAGRWLQDHGVRFAFETQGIVLCQVLVSVSFGVRAMKLAFDSIPVRHEHVAMTLGCTRAQAFWRVALPMARSGLLTSGILIWTRALGLFGAVQIFVGAVRMKTEVLPTAIYLETSVGNLEAAVAIMLLMIALALCALVLARLVTARRTT